MRTRRQYPIGPDGFVDAVALVDALFAEHFAVRDPAPKPPRQRQPRPPRRPRGRGKR